MTSDKQLVNIRQATRRCGVSRRTIYNWLNAGKIQYVRTASGRVAILAESLWGKGNVAPDGTITFAPREGAS